MSRKRRCVCGNSKTFPLCDYSHHSEGWDCTQLIDAVAPLAFVAGTHQFSLAEKLAAEFRGVAVHLADATVKAERCIVITDGTDLDEIQVFRSRVSATHWNAIGMDVPENLLRSRFPDWSVAMLNSAESFANWAAIRSLVESQFESTPPSTQPENSAKLFVSHSVQDEPMLMPGIDYLRRQFEADIFLCSDSIRNGSDWHAEIMNRLRECDRFVWMISESSVQSTFCSFEVGFAMASEKPMSLISLDGTMPPPFAQPFHVEDVPRMIQQKPWLETDEVLLDSLMRSLAARD